MPINQFLITIITLHPTPFYKLTNQIISISPLIISLSDKPPHLPPTTVITTRATTWKVLDKIKVYKRKISSTILYSHIKGLVSMNSIPIKIITGITYFHIHHQCLRKRVYKGRDFSLSLRSPLSILHHLP